MQYLHELVHVITIANCKYWTGNIKGYGKTNIMHLTLFRNALIFIFKSILQNDIYGINVPFIIK